MRAFSSAHVVGFGVLLIGAVVLVDHTWPEPSEQHELTLEPSSTTLTTGSRSQSSTAGLSSTPAWIPSPEGPPYKYAPTDSRTFRSPECHHAVREALAGKNIVIVGDTSSRYQYISLIYYLLKGEYPEADLPRDASMVGPQNLCYEQRHIGKWPRFILDTIELTKGSECTDVRRANFDWATFPKIGRPEWENRYFVDKEFGFNVSFFALQAELQGSYDHGFTEDCRLPKVVPDIAEEIEPKWYGEKEWLKHVESYSSRPIDHLLLSIGAHRDKMALFRGDYAAKLREALTIYEKSMVPGEKPTYATFSGNFTADGDPRLYGHNPGFLMNHIEAHHWNVFHRQLMLANMVHTEGISNADIWHTPLNVYGYVNAALNDKLLDQWLPKNLEC